MSLGTPCPPHSGNLLHLFINIPILFQPYQNSTKSCPYCPSGPSAAAQSGSTTALPTEWSSSWKSASPELSTKNIQDWQKQVQVAVKRPPPSLQPGWWWAALKKKNSHATGKRSTSPLDYKKIANVHYASSDFFLKYCIDYFFSCGDKTPDRNCS